MACVEKVYRHDTLLDPDCSENLDEQEREDADREYVEFKQKKPKEKEKEPEPERSATKEEKRESTVGKVTAAAAGVAAPSQARYVTPTPHANRSPKQVLTRNTVEQSQFSSLPCWRRRPW